MVRPHSPDSSSYVAQRPQLGRQVVQGLPVAARSVRVTGVAVDAVEDA